jgi:hypothetical protein
MMILGSESMQIDENLADKSERPQAERFCPLAGRHNDF